MPSASTKAATAHKDPRVDAYIAKSADFAKPILAELRAIIHDACPEVVETIKWSFPNFTYKGKILCNMASFKEHCSFGFWNSSMVLDPNDNKSAQAMGQFGRLTSLKDLPPKKLIAGYIKKAADLLDRGVKPVRPKPTTLKKELVIPDYFTASLKQNKKAQAAFDGFPYSHKKEYVEWITEAKTEETRQRRIATALEWLAEGKSRNWKYQKC